jgi:hypothetical protein
MEVVSLDAPIGGWDAFHSLDQMEPTSAVILNNLIPGAGSVETRRGYIVFQTVPSSNNPVETLASYNPKDPTSSELLAASGGGIWQVDPDAVVEIKPVGTFTSDRWQTENFQKADETGVLIWCNGTDTTQVYNGTTMVDIDTTGTDAGLSLTPNFIGCITFKGRMYYWLDNDNAFYYTQAGAYQGEFRKFDLGTFVQQGGELVSVISWTQQDAGEGRDDFLVFVFSTGEVLVYQGDDPDSTGYWEQVGRYLTAEPLSIRGYTQYGADAILMTKDGYVSMASIIQEGRTSDVPAFSRMIHKAITDRTRNASSLYGWDVELYQRDGLMIFNVPLSLESYEQHVMNTVTNKWCRFRDLQVNCLRVHDEKLYGGAENGEVHGLLQGTNDNGNPIEFDALYSFNYYDAPGVQKVVTAAQVFSTHTRPDEIVVSGWADFEVPELGPIPIPSALPGAIWGVDAGIGSLSGALWDTEYWSNQGVQVTTKGWQNVSAYGFAVAILVRFSKINEGVTWRSTTIRHHKIGSQ